MKSCIFVGPTLSGISTPPEVIRYGPAKLGSVYRAAEAGYKRIGIIDGLFGNVPSVWHKEILFAIAHGVEVSGSSSMGALRAAELSQFGMKGIGTCYRLFRFGCLTDDDELAVVHAPEELDYCVFSEAMVNIRVSLRLLRRHRVLTYESEEDIVRSMKSLHFSERTPESLKAAIALHVGDTNGHTAYEAYQSRRVDVKKNDALRLIRYLALAREPPQIPNWEFPITSHWRTQFQRYLADVPGLEKAQRS